MYPYNLTQLQAHAQSLWHAMQRRNGDAAGAGPGGAASQASVQQQPAQLAGPLGSSVELSGMSLAEELPSMGLVGGLGSGLWMYDGGLYDMEDLSGDMDAGLFAATPPPPPMPPAAAMSRAPAAAGSGAAASGSGDVPGGGKGGAGKAAAGEAAGQVAPGKPPLPGQGPAAGAAAAQKEAPVRQQGHAGGKEVRGLGGQRGKRAGAGREGRPGRHRVDTATVARKLPRCGERGGGDTEYSQRFRGRE